jgi:hypothetical protein
VRKIRRNNKNDNIIHRRNINMLNKLLSDSFWRGNDIFVCDCVLAFGKGISDLGSKMGSDGEGGVDSTSICSDGISGFVSVFYK